MPDGRDVICTFDGTFDGFLSVVYYAVKNRIRPVRVCAEHSVQTRLDTDIRFIATDTQNAERVRVSAMEQMGYDGFKRAYYVFLNGDGESASVSYLYLLYGFKYGKNTYQYMSVPDINRAYKLESQVVCETDRMKGFLRFAVMEGGVEYAQIEPENDILALLMPHFADRLKTIPFVIHDILRKKAGVYAKGRWIIADADGLPEPKMADDEAFYAELWRSFYNAVSIEERKNLKLQTNMMPKKYRKHMTEFQCMDFL